MAQQQLATHSIKFSATASQHPTPAWVARSTAAPASNRKSSETHLLMALPATGRPATAASASNSREPPVPVQRMERAFRFDGKGESVENFGGRRWRILKARPRYCLISQTSCFNLELKFGDVDHFQVCIDVVAGGSYPA